MGSSCCVVRVACIDIRRESLLKQVQSVASTHAARLRRKRARPQVITRIPVVTPGRQPKAPVEPATGSLLQYGGATFLPNPELPDLDNVLFGMLLVNWQ